MMPCNVEVLWHLGGTYPEDGGITFLRSMGNFWQTTWYHIQEYSFLQY
jgi:hypothetical protein